MAIVASLLLDVALGFDFKYEFLVYYFIYLLFIYFSKFKFDTHHWAVAYWVESDACSAAGCQPFPGA